MARDLNEQPSSNGLDANNSALMTPCSGKSGSKSILTDINAEAQRLFKSDGDCASDTPVLRTRTDGAGAVEIVSQDITKLKDYLSHKVAHLDLTEGGVHLNKVDEEFVCGWGAAFINIVTTFPVNKAIFRQQLHGISGLKALRQLKKEGLRNLYRGLLPPLLQKTTSLSIMFGSYHKFQQTFDAQFKSLPKQVNHAGAAMLAGTLEMSLTPFERIQVLLQNRTYQERFNNTFHAAKELRLYGFKEYYRGATCIFLRNGPSNVIFFLGREQLNTHMPELENASSRLAKDFICGACLGALISTLFFPLNTVKTRMQAHVGGPFHNLWDTFQLVLGERNYRLSSLFRGVHLNYSRSFISWGIINASYELLMQYFRLPKAKADGSL